MQHTSAVPSARLGPPALAMALAVLALLALPVSAQAAPHAARASAREAVALASAGWHGRAIRDPRPRPRLVRTDWPAGWSAGAVGPGSGYVRPGGSERVRELQRRLRQLGYRPGPIDGLFGPRTHAATRWFQYKHGLALTGRVNTATLAVLQARSDHKPLPTRPRADTPAAQPAPTTAPEAPTTAPAAPVAAEDGSEGLLFALLLIALALALGVITGLIGPQLRRTRAAAATPPPPALTHAPTPARRTPPARRGAPPVLGYATVTPDSAAADAATAALALRCTRGGWHLIEVVHDGDSAGRRLNERPGLTYAITQIRAGTATGLIVARLRDFNTHNSDLSTLLQTLDDADAFLAAADHDLDTTTRAGQATARAIVDLGRWHRHQLTQHSSGRFTPNPNNLAPKLAAMHERGISLRAIADALNLANIPTPPGHTRWHTTDVKAVTEHTHHT